MIGGAAGNNVNPGERVYVCLVKHRGQLRPAVNYIGRDGALNGFGLLHDLLEHIMLIAALVGGGNIPIHSHLFFFYFIKERGIKLYILICDNCNFVVLKVGDGFGILHDRHNVRGKEVALLTVGNDEGRVAFQSNNGFRLVSANDTKGIAALKLARGFGYRLKDASLVVVVNKLSGNLCIRFRFENSPAVYEHFLYLSIVFYNAVVNNGNTSVLADMGM